MHCLPAGVQIPDIFYDPDYVVPGGLKMQADGTNLIDKTAPRDRFLMAVSPAD